MTDAGAFERLISAVLRKADPAAAALIHSGVNADGRPIPGPVDGFSVHGAGTHQLLVCAHTTMALSGLRAKWLAAGDGDIAKAARTAEGLGVASARLILSTSHEPPLDLAVEAHATAASYGLHLDVWTASRLADFIDDDAEGQWVGHRFFGHPAHRLSRSMLEDSAQAGPTEIPIFDAPAAIAPRADAVRLVEQFEGGSRAILLVAASGQGKTTIARQVWAQLADLGAGAIHVSHGDVDASASLAEAMTRALRRRAPNLSERCGTDAETLAGVASVLVLIEDINHSARPDEALRKVIGWMRLSKAQGLRILCPIWPRALARLPEQERHSISDLTVWLELPTLEEALALARAKATSQGVRKSEHQLTQVVRRLGRDPLLIGLQDFAGDDTGGVSGYIAREAERIAASTSFGTSEVLEALAALGEGMLRHRVLAPLWSEARCWLSAEHQTHVRQLAQSGAILRLTTEDRRETLAFRHDRVRDEIRALGLRSVLLSGDQDIADDPAYAELWGLILADPASDLALMDRAAAHNPLGLFHALSECAEHNPERRAALAQCAGRWLSVTPKTNRRLRWACQFAIREFEAPEALTLLAGFGERTWMIQEALCLNGDWESCLTFSSMWNSLGPRPREDRLFSHLQARRGKGFLEKIKSELSNEALTDARLTAVLGVAGRLRAEGLEDTLRALWHTRPKTSLFIAAMIWACALCAPTLLPEVLVGWSRLSNRKAKNKVTPRNKVSERVNRGLSIMAPDKALPALVARGRHPRDALFWQVGALLEGWDHPDAQEFFVRYLVAASVEASRKGRLFLGLMRIGEVWRKDRFRTGRPMSAASLQRLSTLWRDAGQDVEVRRMALRIWGNAAPRKLLDQLRPIEPVGQLGREVVRFRLEMEDPSVAQDFQALLQTDVGHAILWQHARGHWQPCLLPVLEWSLGQLRDVKAEASEWRLMGQYALPDLMMELDEVDRERLLLAHWDHMKSGSRWVQLALWTATSASLALVRDILATSDAKNLLQYVTHHYGLQREDYPAVGELRRLQVLEPYLDLLEPSDLSNIAECCDQMSWHAWRQTHIDGRLSDNDGRRHFRTQAKRWQEFDSVSEKGERDSPLSFFLEQMVETVGGVAPILQDVDVWVRQRRSKPALRVACGVVVEIGTREALSMVMDWLTLGIEDAEAMIEDTVFGVCRRSLN